MKIRTYHQLTGADASDLGGQIASQRSRMHRRLALVRSIIAVMSGKGGVGKSFVTAALATALARRGLAVGVLDADLHGPTAARMLGVGAVTLAVRDDGVEPATGAGGVRVMSTDLLLPEGAPLRWREPGSDGFIWRGALEAGMLREFLSDVLWGQLDVMLVDLPPGTERLGALLELVPQLAGIVAVTIPADASRRAVARALQASRSAGARVLGIVENMSGYACAHCGHEGALFDGDAAQSLAAAAGAPVLASLPFNPAAQAAADAGRDIGDRCGAAMDALAHALLVRLDDGPPVPRSPGHRS